MGTPHDRMVTIPLPTAPRLRDRVLGIPLPIWPWRKLVATQMAAVCAGLASAAVIYSLVRWDGSYFDRPGGAAVSLPTRIGAPFTVGFNLPNTHDRPIVVERIGLAGAPPAIHVLGMELTPRGGAVGIARGWAGGATQVHGFVIPPHSKLAGVNVGLRVDQPGSYVVRGLRVWYRAGPDLPLLGRGHYVQTTGIFVGVCASASGKCRLPQPR